jgi:hypothetical protein
MTLTHQNLFGVLRCIFCLNVYFVSSPYGLGCENIITVLSSIRKTGQDLETAKLKLYKETQSVRKVERSLLPKCPCCILHGGHLGNLHSGFDQRGPPPSVGWYLGGGKTLFL